MESWVRVCSTADIISDGGGCVKVSGHNIAIFNLNRGREWYAVQNTCPHQNQSVLSRGLVGEENGEPKIACPLHKTKFSLVSGRHLDDDPRYQLSTYPIKVVGNDIYLIVDQPIVAKEESS